MILNTTLFNEGMLNGSFTLAPTPSSDLLVFDGFSLSDLVNSVCTYLDDSMPAREIEEESIPRTDGTFFIQGKASVKTITAKGYFKAADKDAMEDLLDLARKILWRKEKSLDITKGATKIRRYVATLDNPESIFSERQGTDITKCDWSVTFKARNPPFGKDRDYSSVTQSFTLSPTNQAVSNLGTESALPVITLIFDAATAITAASITNTTNGDKITYTGALIAGDILEFNTEALTMKKNGVQVDYTGKFIALDTGTNTLSYTITGTSFNATATISHKNTFL